MAKLREDRTDACQINEAWAMDFRSRPACHRPQDPRVYDRRYFSRFLSAVDPRFGYRGEDVVLILERICKTVGFA
jgi:putative transposase